LLLEQVDAFRVRAKFREMMGKYKSVCIQVGFRTTQRTGESGRDTEGMERDNMKMVEKKAQKIWPHWSAWYVAFGHCARADMSKTSESLTPLKRDASQKEGMFYLVFSSPKIQVAVFFLLILIVAHHHRRVCAATKQQAIRSPHPHSPAQNTRSKVAAGTLQ
jgi:hypothetical protein